MSEMTEEQAKRILGLYNELILAVAKKFPGETRHQTALRYIMDAEKHIDGPAQQENR